MKVCIIGGTSFVGRAIAWSAWHHGHRVSVLNRGLTNSDLPEGVERLVGDRQGDLTCLKERTFDATVDVIAYRPSDVENLAHALAERGGHYLQISSVSAYAEPPAAGAREESLSLKADLGIDLAGPVTGSTYGTLKAASERAGLELFGDSATFVRPTFVVGAHDATLRFPYWVERVRRGGRVAVPGPRSAPLQYVDARDLANLVVRAIEDGRRGGVHVAGPHPDECFFSVIEQIASHLAPPGTTLEEVEPADVLAAALGDRLPLWSAGRSENLLTLDSSLALSYGLDLRPLADTLDDVVEWWGGRPWPGTWLSEDDEARLFARAL